MDKKIKLCIFDMDGTLINTEQDVWLVGKKKLISELGIPFDEYFFSSKIGYGYDDMIKILNEHFGKDFDGAKFMKDLFDYYVDYVYENKVIPAKKGSVEILKYLHDNHIKIALGTSTRKKYANMILSNLGVLQYFDYLVCGDDVKNGKPDPEIFLKSQIASGFDKDECLVFEDSIAGLKTALNAGIKCAIVKDIYPYQEHDLDEAEYVFDNLLQAIPVLENLIYK